MQNLNCKLANKGFFNLQIYYIEAEMKETFWCKPTFFSPSDFLLCVYDKKCLFLRRNIWNTMAEHGCETANRPFSLQYKMEDKKFRSSRSGFLPLTIRSDWTVSRQVKQTVHRSLLWNDSLCCARSFTRMKECVRTITKNEQTEDAAIWIGSTTSRWSGKEPAGTQTRSERAAEIELTIWTEFESDRL